MDERFESRNPPRDAPPLVDLCGSRYVTLYPFRPVVLTGLAAVSR